MDTNKLTQHIRKTLVHTLVQHQYGVVDDAKNYSIVRTMVNYLQGLVDTQTIIDFSLSVVNLYDDHISASIVITQLTGTEPFLIKYELTTIDEPKSPVTENDFDRAMKGV